jgi:hypothetical protein
LVTHSRNESRSVVHPDVRTMLAASRTVPKAAVPILPL